MVDLWADRTAALGARDDVAYVLVFGEPGARVGATIPTPTAGSPSPVPPAPTGKAHLYRRYVVRRRQGRRPPGDGGGRLASVGRGDMALRC